MTEPQRHVFTSAAVSDDVALPPEPHARERQLLLSLAIAASLPRVLWGLTIDATMLIDGSSSMPLWSVLRMVSVALDVVCLVVIAKLKSLDAVVPASAVPRAWAFRLGVAELMISFVMAGFFGSILGIIPFGLGFSLPSLAATISFAYWLKMLLKPRASFLMPVAFLSVFVQAVGYGVFGRIPLFATLVGVAFAVEVMRARRTLEPQ